MLKTTFQTKTRSFPFLIIDSVHLATKQTPDGIAHIFLTDCSLM